jgi:bifunctional enzyme CysN/CysC
VNRPNQDFRGYAGTIASGRVRTGDAVTILPSGRVTRVERIVAADGDLAEAGAGQAVTLTLADEVDCSRGDVIAAAGGATIAAALDASLVWMAEEVLEPGRSYWLKSGAQTVSATVAVGDVLLAGGGQREGAALGLNDIGNVRIALDRRLAATIYADNRALGGFILIDKATHATVAAGMIRGFPASVGDAHVERIFWVAGEVEAEQLRARFASQGRSSFTLTGTALREELGEGLDPGDAVALTRRAAGVARLLAAAGVTIIAAIPPAEGVEIPGSLVGFDAPGEDWVI